MKFSEFQNAATTNAPPAATPAAQTKNAPLDPKTRAGAAAVSRALGGKPNAKFAQAIDQAEKGKALNPSLLQSLAPFAGALEKIFADPALRTKFLAMVKLVKAVENVTEDQDSIDAVSSAVTRRIMMQHTDLLGKYGPVKVMAAINDVADFAGSDGLEEIGSSDVSIWTKQVIQDLEAGHYDRMESAEQLDEILPAIGAAVGRAVVGSGASAVTRSVAGGVGHVAGTMAQDALGDSDEDPTDADSENDEVDTVTLDVPLLLRMMEYAREDAREDMDLHNAAERMIELSKNGALSMDDYESIVGDVEALPAPDKVNVTINSTSITVKGPKGELSKNLPTSIKIIQNDKTISVLPSEGLNDSYQLYGTYRSLVSNMITGVTEGFQRKLELQGVGYRSQIDGKTLILNVGYSHQVKILSPEGIKLSVEGNTNVTVSGLDKELVGQIAADIRLVRPPEPYKGKGIRYQGEYVRKKVGKAGKK